MNDINVECREGLEFLKTIESNTVDLILTDPPYLTSRDSGMDKWVAHVARQDKENAPALRTVEQWRRLKTAAEWTKFLKEGGGLYKKADDGQVKYRSGAVKNKLSKYKADFLKYGSIYGKKYAVKTDFGEWDNEFTLSILNDFVKEFYRILRPGGTCIVFFDLWKITTLKEMLETAGPVSRKGNPTGFAQLRFIEWIKTNPQPLNSKRNYLTNCREIAITAVKKGKGTFNSEYDNGIYEHPIYAGKDRFHPTQKSLDLFEDLINKHSHEGDLVVDCFLGSGTTALAACHTNRKFSGCELDEEYYNKTINRLTERVPAWQQKIQETEEQERRPVRAPADLQSMFNRGLMAEIRTIRRSPGAKAPGDTTKEM